MAERRSKPNQTAKRKGRSQPVNPRKKLGGGKVDELGVVRGQNAEKTGPTRSSQIRDEGLVSH